MTILVAPCFLFRFAVPLARQYEVFKRIMNRDFSDIAGLPRRIMPIALLDKGVMCAGMPVYKDEKLTGYVTSGTMVPYYRHEGDGLQTVILEETAKRSIGRAIVDAPPFAHPIIYRPDEEDTAAAEALAMCRDRKRNKAYVSACADPQTIVVMRTYCFGSGMELEVIPEQDGRTDLQALKAALCAFAAGVYLTSMGSEGLTQAARLSMSKAHYLAGELEKIGMPRVHTGEYFHEFVAKCEKPEAVLKALDENGILGGLPAENGILWCVTEVVSREEIDRAVAIIKEVC